MSDRWEKIDPDRSISETPPAETGGPPEWTGIRLRQFSRWLERWAIYAHARADLADGQVHAAVEPDTQPITKGESPLPTQSPSETRSPAHWHGTATQGPPAHWLALFESQQPEGEPTSDPQGATEMPMAWIHRFQSELADYLAITDINADGEASLGSTHGTAAENLHPPVPVPGPTEDVPTTQSQGPPDPPGPNNFIQPESTGQEAGTSEGVQPSPRREWIETDRAPSGYKAPDTADADQPTKPESQESETHLTQRLPVPSTGEPDQTAIRQSSESRATPGSPSTPVPGPADGQVTQLQLRSPAAKGSPSHPPDLDSLPNAQSTSENLGAGYPITTLRLKGTPSASPMEPPPPAPVGTNGQDSTPQEPDFELEPGSERQKRSATDPPPATPTQPDGMDSFPDLEESRNPEPVWPEHRRSAKPTPVRWPKSSTHSLWPELPEPSPIRNTDSRPCQDPARRRRIDREQGGR